MPRLSDSKIQALAEKEKNRDDLIAKGYSGDNVLQRVFKGGLGTSLLARNIPQVANYVPGHTTLYHGTNPDLLPSIMDKGLSIEYAGSKGRINSLLIPNGIIATALQNDINLSRSDMEYLSSRLGEAIRNPEVRQGRLLRQIAKDEITKVMKIRDISDAKIDEVIQKVDAALPESGLRLYFGQKPHMVGTWSDNKNEAGKVIGAVVDGIGEEKPKFDIKQIAKSIVDSLTGGMLSTGEDLHAATKYKPTIKGKLSTEEIKALVHKYPGHASNSNLKELATELMGNLGVDQKTMEGLGIDEAAEKLLAKITGKTLEKPDIYHMVLGVDVPTHHLDNLNDFKGFRKLVQVNPGMQSSLKFIPGFQTYEPGRDLSIPHGISPEQIKHVDFINKDGEVVRYLHDGYKAPEITTAERLSALRRAALPGTLALVGADLLQSAVTGKQLYITRGIKDVFGRLKSNEKKAAFTPGLDTLKATAKYILPATAVVAGTGLAAGYLAEKALPISEEERSPKTVADYAVRVSKDVGRSVPIAIATQVGLPILGAAIAPTILRGAMKDAPAMANLAAKLGLGAGAGMVLSPVAARVAENYLKAKKGENAILSSVGVSKKDIENHAILSAALAPSLGMVGALGGATYSIKRYYPALGLAATNPLKGAQGAEFLGVVDKKEVDNFIAERLDLIGKLKGKGIASKKDIAEAKSMVDRGISRGLPGMEQHIDTLAKDLKDHLKSESAHSWFYNSLGKDERGREHIADAFSYESKTPKIVVHRLLHNSSGGEVIRHLDDYNIREHFHDLPEELKTQILSKITSQDVLSVGGEYNVHHSVRDLLPGHVLDGAKTLKRSADAIKDINDMYSAAAAFSIGTPIDVVHDALSKNNPKDLGELLSRNTYLSRSQERLAAALRDHVANKKLAALNAKYINSFSFKEKPWMKL